MVAMFGSIMPAPLAIAQMTTSPMRTLHTFGPRSVVKIARAASSRAAGRSLRGDAGDRGLDLRHGERGRR